MNPDFFSADLGQVFEATVIVALLAFVIERIMAVIVEHKLYKKYLDDKGLSTPIALIISYAVCWFYHFDLPAIIFKLQSVSWFGMLLTAMLISGGRRVALELMGYVIELMKRQKVKEQSVSQDINKKIAEGK